MTRRRMCRSITLTQLVWPLAILSAWKARICTSGISQDQVARGGLCVCLLAVLSASCPWRVTMKITTKRTIDVFLLGACSWYMRRAVACYSSAHRKTSISTYCVLALRRSSEEQRSVVAALVSLCIAEFFPRTYTVRAICRSHFSHAGCWNTLQVTRGAKGSTPASHRKGGLVYRVIAGGLMDEITLNDGSKCVHIE